MLGAIIGDVVGSIYEFNNDRRKEVELFTGKNFLTDDSIMTLAVCEIMQKRLYMDKDKVIDTLKKWGRAYPNRGYGIRFNLWLNSNDRSSYRSYGNGAAMRISSVGWYGRDEEEVKELSRLVTEVTHSHIEGLKGAEVVAMCIYYARMGKDKDFIKKYVEQFYNLDFNYEDLKTNYEFNETCQQTVPQAIYCFLISNDFEDCLRTSISIGGDSDTVAAIACSIAEAYYKYIDNDLILKVLELFPNEKNGCYPFSVLEDYLMDRNNLLVNNEEINEDTKLIGISYQDEDDSYIDFIYSSSLYSLSEYLIFNELDNIIGIEADDTSKMYYNERNLNMFLNDLSNKYKSFPNNIMDILTKILKETNENKYQELLKELNISLNKISNVELLYFKNPSKAIEYLNLNYEGVNQIYNDSVKFFWVKD